MYAITNFNDGGNLYPLFYGLNNPIDSLVLKKYKQSKPVKREVGEIVDGIDLVMYKKKSNNLFRGK